MRSPSSPWPVPPLSSDVPAAIESYRAGIAALVAGGSSAEALLRRCTGLDPDFFLGHLALAVCLAHAGAPFTCEPPTRPLSRPERQHGEIVRAAYGEAPAHALDLRREHLLEFPGDLLVVWLPCARRRSPTMPLRPARSPSPCR
jgi:hypothetical protein